MVSNNYTTEVWKDIDGYEGLYQVSSHGRVKSLVDDTVIKLGYFMNGEYLRASLGKNSNGRNKSNTVHCLVAAAFIGKRPDNYVVNHKDLDKENNHISNLEYITHAENIQHAANAKKIAGGYKRLSKDQVLEIIDLLDRGQTPKDIACIYNVKPPAIQNIRNNRTWQQIPRPDHWVYGRSIINYDSIAQQAEMSAYLKNNPATNWYEEDQQIFQDDFSLRMEEMMQDQKNNKEFWDMIYSKGMLDEDYD